MVLGVLVDSRPRDMTLQDCDEPLITGMTSKDAAMSISKNSLDQLGRNDGLQDRDTCGTRNGFPTENAILYDEALEILFVEGVCVLLR